ncbi:MAG: DUF362 domain-containing protein [Deltaproteobacteria bacterium]|nr:DUF362 domain-containing protein [Deltaproteobacteria bacterium]
MSENPKVYHLLPHSKTFSYGSGLMGKFESFLKDFDLAAYVPRDSVVPVKMHLGNRGAFRTIRPAFVRAAVDAVKRVPAVPFVTDSARIPACEYLNVAMEAGYTHLTLGAPVVIADGMFGNDSIKVHAGETLGEMAIASAIHDATAMVVLTHVKGHIQAVLGGALKNVSMGGISNHPRGGDWHQGRGKMHFLMGDLMEWDAEKCILCQDCMNVCPAECITFPDDVYTVDKKKCWRCGRCARICPVEAISVPTTHEQFMRAVAEGARAVLSTFEPKRVVYVSFLLEMQPECDCMPLADPPIAQDQGILISDDPVAIDTATLDLLSRTVPLPESRAASVTPKEGWDLFSLLHRKDGRLLLREAEKLGLGRCAYDLEVVG